MSSRIVGMGRRGITIHPSTPRRMTSRTRTKKRLVQVALDFDPGDVYVYQHHHHHPAVPRYLHYYSTDWPGVMNGHIQRSPPF